MTALQVALGLDVSAAIKAKIDPQTYAAWFNAVEISQSNNDVTLVCQSKFNADFIRSTFSSIFHEIESECGVTISVNTPRPALRVISNDNSKGVVKKTSSLSDSSFDEFICCEANQFALSAVKKCASGIVQFSPLVIHGASGSGKSFLLRLLAKNTDMNVVSTTGMQFVNDFVRSMKENNVFAFKDAMRRADMFIMDDIQGLAGKRASSEEFGLLVTDLIRMGKNVVLTSNIAPSQITGFGGRLASLLSSGLSVDLVAPDADVRSKMLQKLGIPAEIAKNCPANGHIVGGIVKKINAWKELDCGELTDSVMEKLLGDVLVKQNTPCAMVKNMCAKLGVAFDDVMGATRVHAVVFARQKIMAVLKTSTNLTLSEIGRVVGGRDHASVLYAISQIEKAKQSDLMLDAELKGLAA